MDRNSLSLLTGYLSVVCWLIVFTPQFIENYKRKSGESLSMTFLVIWLAGDIFNLLGVVMQNLLVTMFVLALYYTVSDICLIWQIFHYRHKQVLFRTQSETDPLLYRKKMKKVHSSSQNKKWFDLFCGSVIILTTGLSCYFYYQAGHQPDQSPLPEEEIQFNTISQVMGWSSALLYVGSRIPQLLKNWENKSTDGLSIGMFICAVMGNILFTSSIFLKSTHPSYIIMNLSWIVGSVFTVVFDFLIFVQFFIYNRSNDDKTIV
ncbi:PQ-loop-domain-containing protein [Backusella circina FSU 941]|nr:PQ-loop-domain-containing protein [Backusella circina FSU 941]